MINSSVLLSSLEKSMQLPPIPIPDTLRGLDDLIRADLEAYRDFWFHQLLLATLLVVVGLVLEGPELWYEITSIIRQWCSMPKFSTPEKHAPNWVKLLAFIGWLLIVGGVAGEYVADSFLSKADGYVEQFDEILLKEATRQSSSANAKSAMAYARAAETERGAAQLKKDAEAEHSARVKIEARVAWRTLDPKTKSEIESHLNQFAKASALVAYNGDDVEAAIFASDIASALHAAKWDVPEPLAFNKMRAGPVPFGTNPPIPTGVLVWPTNDKVSVQAASALVEQLRAYGFDAVESADARYLFAIHPTPTRVAVSVEHKPEGPQGEFKLQAEREIKNNSKNKTK